MKPILIYLLLFPVSLLATRAQTPTLPTPQGWTAENFPFPPAFAPSLPYKGAEHIRFAPAWADSTAESYWSYVFAWQVEGPVAPRPDSLRRQLIAYYNGLYLANRTQAPSGYGPEFTQVRITPEPQPWPLDKASFTGKAYTYNYLTGRQIDLLFKIHLRPSRDGKETLLVFEVSPKPYSHPFWKTLAPLAAGAHF